MLFILSVLIGKEFPEVILRHGFTDAIYSELLTMPVIKPQTNKTLPTREQNLL
jgi:hypothetical protein